MFFRKHLAEATALALAVTSAVPSGLPAAAKTAKSGLSAAKDNLTYTFFSTDFEPYADSVSLSDLAGAEEEQILRAAGESDASVYTAHADFLDADGNAAEPEDPILISISQDSREDNRNVRIFALDNDELETGLENLASYELEMKTEDDLQYWNAGTSTDYVVVVEDTDSVSAETSDLSVSAEGVQKGASLSVEEGKSSGGNITGSIVLENSRFVPSAFRISMSGENDNTDGSSVLKLRGNGVQVSVTGDSGFFRLSENAKRLLEDTRDKNGAYSADFTLCVSGTEESNSGNNTAAYTGTKKTSRAAARAVSENSVVLRENGTTQKATKLDDNEYAYIDKYITKIDGKEVNGQATYTTTIEQAVSSDTVVPSKAPKKQDIVMILDSSASMGDKVDSTNSAVNTFFTRIMQVNKERKAKWDNGEYDDSAGDVLENHLLSVNAVIKYNNKVTVLSGSKITPMTQTDVERIVNAAHLKNGYEPNGSLYDMTRTDLALAKAKTYITDPANTSIVLMTDGEPYGRGDEGALDYDTDTYSGLMMTYENTNSALRTARSIKDNGSTIYAVYVQSGYPSELIDNAKASGNISDLATTPSQAGGSRVLSDQSLGCAFLSMVSSDYPQNGQMHGDSDGSGDYKLTGTYDNPGSGVFGRYFKMPEEIKKMVDSFADVANDINDKTSYSFGYAGPSSYIYDVISYPFHADTSSASIRVYQVPRICYGVENGQKLFRWGDEEDITNKVTASIENGRYITVQGYNYERNAISSFNKHLKAGEEETLPSASGDYGYKVVVRFNIYADRIFGGNGIETNDSSVSGFYPAAPGQKQSWEKNTDLNPNGNRYIDLYPVPKVDLNIDYKVVSDNVVIYAPQTAELDNLVTDTNNSLFATDPAYPALKNEYDLTKEKVDEAYSKYTQAAKDYQASVGTDGEAEALNALQEKQQAYSNAQSDFATAQKNFDTAQNYIPDGDNNAYVDIHYSITDPEGTEIGTMDVPHGTAYDGSNLHWTWNSAAGDGQIRKHGEYKITTTVTPVDTTRQESHTGSTAAGTGKQTSFHAAPSAHIYVYHMTGTDGIAENKEGIRLLEGTLVGTDDIELTSWLSSYLQAGGWRALDGTTPEENGDNPSVMSGATSVYGGKPGISLTVPDKTHLTGENGDFIASGKNGDDIPVAVKVTRQTGKLDKKYSDIDRRTLVTSPMNDNDERYVDAKGNRVSSIVWDHVCDIVTGCDNANFRTAQTKNNTMDGDAQNNVRFLLHITARVLPDISKKTDSATVSKNGTPSWNITLDNKNETANQDRSDAVSSMVDILPYNGDGRQDPSTGEETGSHFEGNLYYKSVTIDCEGSDTALNAFAGGKSKVYFTTDTGIRDIETDTSKVKNFKWTEASVQVQDKAVTVSVPENAVAMRVDSSMPFGDAITITMTAQLDDKSLAKEDDAYLNAAFVYNTTRKDSNITKTTVTSSCISGLVWEDKNADGIRQNSEAVISNVSVGLYTAHNPSGKGAAVTVNGVEYDSVYNADGNPVNQIVTGEDGTYKFSNLLPGTYYVIAQNVSDQYTVTKKHAVTNTAVDSDAEEAMPGITNHESGHTQVTGNTARAWIKDITIADQESRDHMDIGMVPIRGSIDITKTLDQIYYPSTMTEEEKEAYYTTFHFTLQCPDGTVQYATIQLSQKKLTGYAKFENLPAGTYTLREETALNYRLDTIDSDDIEKKDVAAGSVTFTVTGEKQDYHVSFNNKMNGVPPAGDQNQVINHIPMHLPVSLKINYTGPKLIQSATACKYTFSAEETTGIVTYDDGSTQVVKLGTTDGYSLDPLTVTNMMNTKKNNSLVVHGYYTEKGRTLEDNFRVQVDLKPPHKFRVVYHANSSTFANGSDTNIVDYIYDQVNDVFYAYKGTYADPVGKGEGFTYKGWGTDPNGAAGNKYDNEAALKSLAVDSNVRQVDLYARWQTYYIFNGNGGTVSVSRVPAFYGDLIPQSPSVTATRTNFGFVGWRSSASVTEGKWLKDMSASERLITGPRTIYAIWYQSDYYYVGAPQTFTAPADGWYKVQLWGAKGGSDASCSGGNGAYVSGEVHVKAGTNLYVYVGASGRDNTTGSGAGYNGGGNSGSASGGSSGSGGGATDIRTQSGAWNATLYSRIAVAAGGGGAGCHSNGGYGGALTGGSGGGYGGGTQTSAGSRGGFGYGGTSEIDGGGGGGGWYGGGASSGGSTGAGNDQGGGGGSSYMSGFPGCATSSTGYVFRNATMIAGNQLMPSPGGGQTYGNAGACKAVIQLISMD